MPQSKGRSEVPAGAVETITVEGLVDAVWNQEEGSKERLLNLVREGLVGEYQRGARETAQRAIDGVSRAVIGGG